MTYNLEFHPQLNCNRVLPIAIRGLPQASPCQLYTSSQMSELLSKTIHHAANISCACDSCRHRPPMHLAVRIAAVKLLIMLVGSLQPFNLAVSIVVYPCVP